MHKSIGPGHPGTGGRAASCREWAPVRPAGRADTPKLERPSSALALAGGGARSVWWSQLLADVLEVPLALCEGSESGGALDAARLAWLAAGGAETDVCRPPSVRSRFEPVAQAETLRPRHARFRALYSALRGVFANV